LKKNIRKFSVAILGLGKIGMGYDKGLRGDTHVYTHARAFDLHPGFHYKIESYNQIFIFFYEVVFSFSLCL
jgi:hypothetical protein